MNKSNVTPTTAPDGIYVWVCPNCGDWTGAATLPDLSKIPNIRSAMRNLHDEDPSEWGKTIGSRAICQNCRQAGLGDHERVLVEYVCTTKVIEAIERGIEQLYKEEEKTSGVKIRRHNEPVGDAVQKTLDRVQ